MSNLHHNPHLELPPAHVAQQQQQQQNIQQQHHIASVYPQLPSQDELPSYSPYPSPQYAQQPPYVQQPQNNKQQQYNQQYVQQQQQYAQQQHSSQQQYNQPQYNQQPQQNLCHHPLPAQPAFYGTMAPPNMSSPGPTHPQNSQPPSSVIGIHELKTESELVQCPHCHQLVHTVLDYDAGVCTGLSIAGLFLAGCSNGLCLLPWLFPWTKDVTHQCPSCREKIATFTRLERDTRILSPA
ncbi:LITAF-like zinc ribbon domain-containing protein [Helicostylum pulchrum]|uniref:LITAF domain-containing protein n=1 Tax=Helicostylum pulchrum TaxID=562976 RepID=A0ABP9YFP7_9FUNG|nr:LITAF-like zinc ribbon domain-containing protein [Helicostylum pulchrum]